MEMLMRIKSYCTLSAAIADPTSYNGCFHAHEEDEETYRIAGEPALDAGPPYPTQGNQFAKNPLVCCPEGQYAESLDLTFSMDLALEPDSDGGFRERLCKRQNFPLITGGV